MQVERAILVQHMSAEAQRLHPDRCRFQIVLRLLPLSSPSAGHCLQDHAAFPPQAAQRGLRSSHSHVRRCAGLSSCYGLPQLACQTAHHCDLLLQALTASTSRCRTTCWWEQTAAAALSGQLSSSTTPISASTSSAPLWTTSALQAWKHLVSCSGMWIALSSSVAAASLPVSAALPASLLANRQPHTATRLSKESHCRGIGWQGGLF